MSTGTVVLAQLEVQDCVAELYLNDIPVTRIAPPKVNIENVAVEQLLIAGENKLELLVEPGSRPSLARFEQRELPFSPMSAVARLIRFKDGDPGLVEHGELLSEVRFSWQGTPPDRRDFPHSLSARLDMGMAHGRWAFQDAPVLTMNDELTDQACNLLDEVEMAIRMAHADGFWRLTRLQIDDVRRAYPVVTEAALRADLAGLMRHYQSAPDPVIPRDRNRHDFRLVAGGRLLELIDVDYTTSFKLRDPADGSAIPYRIMVARIDSVLRIVR